MSPRVRVLFSLVLLSGCVSPVLVKGQLDQTEAVLLVAYKDFGRMCAPKELATAQAQLDFAKIELDQGGWRRAEQHLAVALQSANEAARISEPCGKLDMDEDTVPDVIDRCIGDKEDLDGDRDEDGCPDVSPWGDDDKDGIINTDDGCPLEPEDLDGDRDDDGCPETSEDTDGDGLINAVDECPDEAEDLDGFEDEDGCPDVDNDGDGILDLADKCASVPEDADDWEDEDGCPEPDNDGDGIPDLRDACRNQPGTQARKGCPESDGDKDGVSDDNDRCPEEAETINGYLDDDGCPDEKPTGVKVTRTQVVISDVLEFESGSATLAASAKPLIDNVVTVLTDSPDMRIRIEGHTDADGGETDNLNLSQARASAVRKALIERGILGERLESVGYGERRPLDTNRTEEGRARNRRVEFHILPLEP